MDTSKAILEKIIYPVSESNSFVFDIKRDDLIDSVISGNKWRKLEYNLLKAEELHKTGIITFGGAFSNHLVATAKVAMLNGLQSIGIVRGEELNRNSNHTLSACTEFGMELLFVSRKEYRQRDDEFYINQLRAKFPYYFIVPEGGKNYYGVIGCQQIISETANNYNHIYLAGGTGTTATGILLSTSGNTIVNVVSALKGSFLENDIKQFVQSYLKDDEIEEYTQRLNVINESHFGGYAKTPDELLYFINEVYEKINLKLDPIYTAKAFYKMINDYKKGNILPTDKVLFVHTGGLQSTYSWRGKINYLV